MDLYQITGLLKDNLEPGYESQEIPEPFNILRADIERSDTDVYSAAGADRCSFRGHGQSRRWTCEIQQRIPRKYDTYGQVRL